MKRMMKAVGLGSLVLVGGMISGCVEGGDDERWENEADDYAEASSALQCGAPAAEHLDVAIRTWGSNGLACTGDSCLSFSASRPQAIAVGGPYPSTHHPVYLCVRDSAGQLGACERPGSAYECKNGQCACAGLIDCAKMILDASCDPQEPLDCEPGLECTCDTPSGC